MFREEACFPGLSVVFAVYAAGSGGGMPFDSARCLLVQTDFAVCKPDGYHQFSRTGGDAVSWAGSAYIPFIRKTSVGFGNFHRFAEADAVIITAAVPDLFIIPMENQVDSVSVHN